MGLCLFLADLSYTGETKEFLSASIAYVNLSSGQITSFSDVLTYLLESQTNPSMLLVYIETFDNIVQVSIRIHCVCGLKF